MNKKLEKVIYWTPRVLSILLILFVSLFALDAFSEGAKWWEMIIGFIIHLVPSFLLVIALVMAWNWPRNGGTFFLALGITFVVFFWSPGNMTGAIMTSVPSFVIGLLFVMEHYLLRRKKDHRKK